MERQQFPRYSVGESMLPFCYFPLERIGAIDRIKSSTFTRKHSVQFVRSNGQSSLPFYFFDHLDHDASTTWQVERNQFDHILLDHAQENGVDVYQPFTAKEFMKNNRGEVVGVKAKGSGGKFHEFGAPITVDASGQYSFAASRNGWRIRDDRLQKIAIWTYFKGAKRDPGLDEGATTVAYLEKKNWVWYIPLQNDIVSVGVVGDKGYLYTDTRNSEQIFQRERKKNQWVHDHLTSAQQVDRYRVTGDVSYRSRYCAGHGLLLVGDAYAFLDPVFSSGLYLALHGGVLAGEFVDSALKKRDFGASQFLAYSTKLRGEIETMRKLVYAFYDPHFSFSSVMKKYPYLKGDLTDCLIGNLYRDFSQLFAALAEFVDVPEPLDYGGPLVSL